MGRKQLIAIDGSKQAEYAFDWYLENFHRDGDIVLLAHCAEFDINVPLPGIQDMKAINEICDLVKKRNDEIGLLTEKFTNTLRQRKIEAKVVLLSGKPGEALTKAAVDEGAQHIIMGTRGLGKIRRTLLGSVSEYVIHHCEVPVTIIRNPDSV